jgi:hypothetical protein
MDVPDYQKDRSAEEADQSDESLDADSPQHRQHSHGGGQAEDRHGIPGANGLHDDAPELCAEACSQGNGRPSLGTPHLLGQQRQLRRGLSG